MCAQPWSVVELPSGALDAYFVANRTLRQKFRDIALFVCFDHQVEMANVIIRCSGSIGTRNFLAIDFGSNGYVLSNWET